MSCSCLLLQEAVAAVTTLSKAVMISRLSHSLLKLGLFMDELQRVFPELLNVVGHNGCSNLQINILPDSAMGMKPCNGIGTCCMPHPLLGTLPDKLCYPSVSTIHRMYRALCKNTTICSPRRCASWCELHCHRPALHESCLDTHKC